MVSAAADLLAFAPEPTSFDCGNGARFGIVA
jgi:hypothetical protein